MDSTKFFPRHLDTPVEAFRLFEALCAAAFPDCHLQLPDDTLQRLPTGQSALNHYDALLRARYRNAGNQVFMPERAGNSFARNNRDQPIDRVWVGRARGDERQMHHWFVNLRFMKPNESVQHQQLRWLMVQDMKQPLVIPAHLQGEGEAFTEADPEKVWWVARFDQLKREQAQPVAFRIEYNLYANWLRDKPRLDYTGAIAARLHAWHYLHLEQKQAEKKAPVRSRRLVS